MMSDFVAVSLEPGLTHVTASISGGAHPTAQANHNQAASIKRGCSEPSSSLSASAAAFCPENMHLIATAIAEEPTRRLPERGGDPPQHNQAASSHSVSPLPVTLTFLALPTSTIRRARASARRKPGDSGCRPLTQGTTALAVSQASARPLGPQPVCKMYDTSL